MKIPLMIMGRSDQTEIQVHPVDKKHSFSNCRSMESVLRDAPVTLMSRVLDETGFPVITENTQVIFAAMVLAPNFFCQKWLRVVLAMIGNPP